MFWQLIVPLAAIAAVAFLAFVGAAKFRQASQVFDRLVGQLDDVQADAETDEVSRRREAREAAGRSKGARKQA
jgi:hypothetical protein